jgi:hypothetical protein
MPEENEPGTEDAAVGVEGVEGREQGGEAVTKLDEETHRVVELLEEVRKEEWSESSNANGTGFRGYGKIKQNDEVSHDSGSVLDMRPAGARLDSPEGSFSIPDDTHSVQVHSLRPPIELGFTEVP